MMAQLRDWIQGLNLGQRLMIFPLIVIYQEMRILAKNNHKASQGLVCGMLFGASAALPFLWPIKLTLLYLLDFGLFVCAAILFTVMNWADLALNGHFTLAGFIAIGTIVVLFQRVPLEEFGPYVPFSVGLGLLVTVHVIPWTRTLFHQGNGPNLGEYIAANHGDPPRGSYQAIVNTSSVRSSERFYGSPSRGWRVDPLVLQHLDGAYLMTTRPDSPEGSSSFDLEQGLPLPQPPSTTPVAPSDPFV